MRFTSMLCALVLVAISSFAYANNNVRVVYVHLTENNTIAVDTFPNWFNLDKGENNVMGVSTERTYKTLLKDKKGETVIVAVIDSGIDIEHEDLKDIIWKNPDEVPGNGKDDDGNGYVDDVYGWNFIGGKGGSHVDQDNLEMTRLMRMYTKKYKNVKEEDLSKKEKKDYAEYQRVKKEYEKKAGQAQQNYMTYKNIYEGYQENLKVVQKHLGKEEITEEDLKSLEEAEGGVADAIGFFKTWAQRGVNLEAFAGLKGAVDYYGDGANYYYNMDFDPRGSVVGDNYDNQEERIYGNNDVMGPDASHGTHVAGIIGAVRGNGVGIEGVANNVQIMVLRVVPNGDERDKDVANAIRYAADNGASVINMSFGKSFSWNKKIVDDAVKYATKKDVLLVHAAGNDSKDNDATDNFPNDTYDKKGLFAPKESKVWVEVGALHWKENEVAGFSNYAAEAVDLFAPGVQLNSTVPGSEYQAMSGTSMASPVVAGVAAVLRSYYPELSAAQIKNILMESTIKTDAEYNKPGSKDERVKMNELCITGGIVNLYEAAKLAEKTQGKRKSKHRNAAAANVNKDINP